MSFAAPIFLALLSLSLIPLIIHLIQRIRLKKVYYSSLFFLTETKRETFSWFQLKEILLLVFRALFIFLLFFSLARPYLKKKILLNNYEASRIIILDDSYSMDYHHNFKTATIQVKKLITELKKGSEAAILTFSGNLSTNLITNLKELESYADSVRVSFSGNTLEPVFDKAINILNNATLPRKEIYVVTDLQKRALSPPINRLRMSKNRPDITIVDVGKKKTENVGIKEISLSPNFPTSDFPAQPLIKIKNYSNNGETRQLQFVITSENDSVISNIKSEVSLGASETKTIPIDIDVRKPGNYRIEVALTSDSLPIDDKRFYAMKIPEPTPILLLFQNPSSVRYIETALKQSYFQIKTMDIKMFRQENLKRYKAIGLLSIGDLTYTDWQRLGYYLIQGGGIFITVDNEIKEAQWTNALSLNLPLAGKPVTVKSSGFVTVEQVKTDNPLMEIFKGSDLSSAKFYSYYELNNYPDSLVLAYFSTKTPFLIKEQNQKLVIALTSFNIDNTDFMFKATFLPLFHRIFTYLSFPMVSQEYQIGDTIKLILPASTTIRIKTPQGEFTQVPTIEAGRSLIRYIDTNEPGFYQIGNEVIAINVLAEEGDLARISEKELTNQNIKIVTDVGGKTTDLSRFSFGLSVLFLILELILLIV